MKKFTKFTLMVMLIAAVMLSSACFAPKEKMFKGTGFTVTLNAGFVEKEQVSLNLYLESKYIIFTGIVESGVGVSLDLRGYSDAVLTANQLTGKEIKSDTGNDGTAFEYFFYEKSLNGKDYFYMGVTKKGATDYYLFNFACETKNKDKYESDFLSYAKTIEVD